MGMERNLSAKGTAGIAIGSSLVVFASITAMAVEPLFTSKPGRHPEFAFFLEMLPVCVLGIAVMWLAIAAFKRGVQQELWDSAALDQVRSRLNWPLWTILSVLMVVCLLGFVIFDITQIGTGRHHYNGYAGFSYFWISPLTALGALRTALRKKPKPGRSTSIWLGEVKPLQSEHWGNR